MLNRLFSALLRVTGLESEYLMRRVAPPAQDGWFRSFEEGAAVDRDGKPLPWYTYPAIEFLQARVRPEMVIFEYGCGNSTLWWAKRVAEVVSVEHDGEWYRRVAARVPPNVTHRHVPHDPPGE
jgi:hypothetical protein